MKSKWMLTGVSSVLALTMLLPTATAADTLSELKQKQQEAQQKQSELNLGIEEKSIAISENQTELERIMTKIAEITYKVKETEAKIDSVQSEIDLTKNEINKLQKSIEELERKIAERTNLLKERARAIQLSGGSVDYIDVLLGANSFIDFIDRFSAVNTLIEADREIMRQQAEDKELLAEQKAAVETKLAEQKERQAELEGLKSSLAAQKSEQAGFVKELEAEQKRLASEKSELEDRFEDEIELSADLEQQIAKEQARLAELARKAEEERQRKLAAERQAAAEAERQRQAAAEKKAQEARLAAERKAASEAKAASKNKEESASRTVDKTSKPVTRQKTETRYTAPAPSSSSAFIRPAAGRHTSGFGGRDIGDGAENHLGYDIANVTGTPIMAAAAGYVSYAGVMGGYGNVVIITHSISGQTHATVYAHMNSIGVSVGQSVSQGQKVGGMGNTGRSTGTHLHFEIHVGPWNGARSNAVNPASYIN